MNNDRIDLETKSENGSTISTSKQESIAKAVELFIMQMEAEAEPEVVRPHINYWRMVICFAVWLAPVVLIYLLLDSIAIQRMYFIFIVIIVTIGSTIACARGIVTYLILLYQKFAPARVRRACVFEPSCSNYMLLAIEKYGVWRGVYKGIKRVLRCHYPNGGVDYP